MRPQSLSDFAFDLQDQKCDGTIGLPIYCFILVPNSNIWPNSTHLRDIKLQRLSDLDFELPRLLKVKSDCAVGLPISFPINFYSNIGPD